jgi:hypothetical protein
MGSSRVSGWCSSRVEQQCVFVVLNWHTDALALWLFTLPEPQFGSRAVVQVVCEGTCGQAHESMQLIAAAVRCCRSIRWALPAASTERPSGCMKVPLSAMIFGIGCGVAVARLSSCRLCQNYIFFDR